MSDTKRFDGGFSTPNSGSSHITVDKNRGTHITTDIGGLGQGRSVVDRIPIDSDGNVGSPDLDIKPNKPFDFNK